jgi:hypothetical protein
MKSAVIALFLGATSAIKVQDAPPYFNEPTWNERMSSAGGFLQISACVNSGVQGVTCSPPNHEYFATGMNGDEDLGEDIIMKGEPYHYNQKKQNLVQWNPVVVESTGPLPACHGNNGPDGKNCAKETCSGTNGPLDGPAGTPCTHEEPDAVPHYNTDPTAGRPYATTGDISSSSPEAMTSHSWPASQSHPTEAGTISQNYVQLSAEPASYAAVSDEAEKVSDLQTPYGHTHTTFY